MRRVGWARIFLHTVRLTSIYHPVFDFSAFKEGDDQTLIIPSIAHQSIHFFAEEVELSTLNIKTQNIGDNHRWGVKVRKIFILNGITIHTKSIVTPCQPERDII